MSKRQLRKQHPEPASRTAGSMFEEYMEHEDDNSANFDHDHQDLHDRDGPPGPRSTATTERTTTEPGDAGLAGETRAAPDARVVVQKSVEVEPNPGASPGACAAAVFREEMGLGVESTLAFEDYLREAVRVCREENDARRDGSVEWRTPLFELTRFVKDHPDLRDMVVNNTPALAFRWVDYTIGTWARPVGSDSWDHWFNMSRDDAEAEFIRVWEYAKVSPRLNPLANALEWSRHVPLNPGSKVMERRPENYAAFLGLVGWLQALRGDCHILIPVEKVGPLLGVSDRTISTYIDFAVVDGFLKRTKAYAHKKLGGEENAGAEYRFDVTCFPELLARAEPGCGEAFEAAVHVEHEDKRRASKRKRPHSEPAAAATEKRAEPAGLPAESEQDRGAAPEDAAHAEPDGDPPGFFKWWAAWTRTPWRGGTAAEVEQRRAVCLGNWIDFGWERHAQTLLNRLAVAEKVLDWREGEDHPDPVVWLGEQMDESMTDLAQNQAA